MAAKCPNKFVVIARFLFARAHFLHLRSPLDPHSKKSLRSAEISFSRSHCNEKSFRGKAGIAALEVLFPLFRRLRPDFLELHAQPAAALPLILTQGLLRRPDLHLLH